MPGSGDRPLVLSNDCWLWGERSRTPWSWLLLIQTTTLLITNYCRAEIFNWALVRTVDSWAWPCLVPRDQVRPGLHSVLHVTPGCRHTGAHARGPIYNNRQLAQMLENWRHCLYLYDCPIWHLLDSGADVSGTHAKLHMLWWYLRHPSPFVCLQLGGLLSHNWGRKLKNKDNRRLEIIWLITCNL